MQTREGIYRGNWFRKLTEHCRGCAHLSHGGKCEPFRRHPNRNGDLRESSQPSSDARSPCHHRRLRSEVQQLQLARHAFSIQYPFTILKIQENPENYVFSKTRILIYG